MAKMRLRGAKGDQGRKGEVMVTAKKEGGVGGGGVLDVIVDLCWDFRGAGDIEGGAVDDSLERGGG